MIKAMDCVRFAESISRKSGYVLFLMHVIALIAKMKKKKGIRNVYEKV
jgi:hypothetical protein